MADNMDAIRARVRLAEAYNAAQQTIAKLNAEVAELRKENERLRAGLSEAPCGTSLNTNRRCDFHGSKFTVCARCTALGAKEGER